MSFEVLLSVSDIINMLPTDLHVVPVNFICRSDLKIIVILYTFHSVY